MGGLLEEETASVLVRLGLAGIDGRAVGLTIGPRTVDVLATAGLTERRLALIEAWFRGSLATGFVARVVVSAVLRLGLGLGTVAGKLRVVTGDSRSWS